MIFLSILKDRISSLGSKQKDTMNKSPSTASINRNVNTVPKPVGPKRKRRDRIPERPNYRFDIFVLYQQEKLRFQFDLVSIYGVSLKIASEKICRRFQFLLISVNHYLCCNA
jgi:hypothetical protein